MRKNEMKKKDEVFISFYHLLKNAEKRIENCFKKMTDNQKKFMFSS